MSFILDALRKAERDRQLGQPPSLTQMMRAPATLVPERPRYRPWVLLAVVVAMTGVLVAFWRLPDPAPAGSAPGVAVAPPGDLPTSGESPAAVTETATTTVPAREEDAAPAVDGAEAFLSLDDLLEAESPASAVEAPVPEAVASGVREPAPPPAAPVPLPEPAAVEPAPVPMGDGPHLLREMPPEFRSSFPAIQIDVHVFDADPGRRWVLVQGRRYAEGDTLPQGARVEAITAEGTVLGWLDQSILVPLTER